MRTRPKNAEPAWAATRRDPNHTTEEQRASGLAASLTTRRTDRASSAPRFEPRVVVTDRGRLVCGHIDRPAPDEDGKSICSRCGTVLSERRNP